MKFRKNKNKTLWQAVYSFFGFWTYTLIDADASGKMRERRVLYWCCLPWGKWFRKFDLVSWRIR
jgi:hypothetical protein